MVVESTLELGLYQFASDLNVKEALKFSHRLTYFVNCLDFVKALEKSSKLLTLRTSVML